VCPMLPESMNCPLLIPHLDFFLVLTLMINNFEHPLPRYQFCNSYTSKFQCCILDLCPRQEDTHCGT
jgi:hypothetical protein